VRYNVLPLDDRRVERFLPEIAGRPTLIKGNSQRLYPGMGRLPENTVLNVKNKSFAVTARVEIPDNGADGVVIAQGGAFGGWSMYLVEGRLTFCYNLLGVARIKVQTPDAVPAGVRELRAEFEYDGGGLGKGGLLRLFIGGEELASTRLEQTVPMIFSPDETMDVGEDLATPVSDDYGPEGNGFTGEIQWVQIDLGPDALNPEHQVPPEEQFRIAMARQ